MGRQFLNINQNLLPSTLRNRYSVMLGTTKGKASASRIYNFIKNNPPYSCLVNNWTNIDLGEKINSLNWERIATSYDGKIQTGVVNGVVGGGGNIYNSYDYGKTWTASSQNFNLNWYDVSMSKDGRIQTAVPQGDYIYNSYDYGKTWIKNINSPQAWWISVCISETGQYQSAVINGCYTGENNGYIYRSSDYGQTWQKCFNYNNSWIGISVSNTGQCQIAVSLIIDGVANPDNVMGYVFNSYDYGQTWTKNSSLSQSYYTCVAINGTGQIQLVGINNCNLAPATPGPILISYDYGKTFTQTSCPFDNWISISVNSSGSIILGGGYQQTDEQNNIVPNTGKMFASYNYGKTWEQTTPILSTWTSTIIAKNACIASATTWGSGIFINNN
jgi:photosystem II stability/assembly factor-like uncharacterized protein